MLLDAACPAGSAVRFGAWLDAHPDYADTVQDASCEYAAMENGTERVRFLKTNCDRFSRYAADASQTVVYQLWLVDGEVCEGVQRALEPAAARMGTGGVGKARRVFRGGTALDDRSCIAGWFLRAGSCRCKRDCVRLRSPGQRPLGVFRWLSHALLHGRSTGRPEILLHIHVQSAMRLFGCAARRPCGRLGRSIGNPKRRPGRALDHRPRRLCCGWPRQGPSASRKRTDVSRSCSCMLTDNRCAEFHAQI